MAVFGAETAAGESVAKGESAEAVRVRPVFDCQTAKEQLTTNLVKRELRRALFFLARSGQCG